MPEAQKQPIILAHRGAKAYAPENTIAAFQSAYDSHADGIELDAKLSKDGEVMVIHDPTVDRTTNGSGRVNQLTLTELKRLDAGGWFDAKFSGEPIPTLDEVFLAVGGKFLINVELTNYTSSHDNLVEKVAALVKKHGIEEHVIFSSFDPLNLRKIAQLIPGCPCGALAMPSLAGIFMRGFVGRWAAGMVHPYLLDVNPHFVAAQHRMNRKVNVWTVNKAEDIQRMLAAGVDGIITDDPILALNLREAA